MNSTASSASATPEFKKHLGRAIDLKNEDRYEEAAQLLEYLRGTNPQSASVYALLGHALWEQGKLPEAVSSFRRAVELSPKSELASLGLFHTSMESGDMRGADAEMNRFLAVADSEEYDAIAKGPAQEKPAK